MNYGKTCENQAKHTDIRLLADTAECQKLSCKPQCQGIRIFNDHLVGLNLKKFTITINKPFYMGLAVLELSKLHMFKYVTLLISMSLVVSSFCLYFILILAFLHTTISGA